MKALIELGILFLISLIAIAIEALLPFTFPPAIIAMFLLLALMMARAVREEHLEITTSFFSRYMALFFIPSSVEIIEHLELLKDTWFQVLLVSAVSLLITFFVTAKTVELTEKLIGGRKHESPDN